MSSRVFVLPALQELKKLLCPPLLKETHKRALDGLHLRARDLRDLAIAINERAGNLLELLVACYVGVDKYAGKLSGGNDEFGDEVNSVVTVAAEILRNSLIGPKLAVELRRSLGV